VLTNAECAADMRLRHPEVPVVPNLDRAILKAIGAGGVLDMSFWHGNAACGATHCRAGWAVELAGEAGRALEQSVPGGTGQAGGLIYLCSEGYLPYFYASKDEALADMRRRAAEAEAAATPENASV
jgi:hypothetical protein